MYWGGGGVQGQPQLLSEFQARLGYRRLKMKEKKNSIMNHFHFVFSLPFTNTGVTNICTFSLYCLTRDIIFFYFFFYQKHHS